MRIVLVTRIWPAHRPGGMGHVAHDRAHALADLGHDVHVLTTGGKPDEYGKHLTVHYLPCETLKWSADFAGHCEAKCRELEPDIIHLDSLDVARPWWVNRPGRVRKVAVTLHGFGFGGWLTKWNLYRVNESHVVDEFPAAALRREAEVLRTTFDRVIGVSLHEQYLLVDQYGIIDAQLVYNPIHPAFFARGDSGQQRSRQMLCAAVSGHGPRLFRVAEKAAEQAGIRLRIVEGASRSTMPHIIDECTAVVVPTAYCQGYDLTVAEALARRRPVILTATGSYLREHQAGLPGSVLVPVRDVEALAQAMQGALPVVPKGASDRHKPEVHAQKWLEAIGA